MIMNIQGILFLGILTYLVLIIIPANYYKKKNIPTLEKSKSKKLHSIPLIVQKIKNIAYDNKINPAILYGIVVAEQNNNNPKDWNTDAYNENDPTGAYGLTQVLGSTAWSFGVNPLSLLNDPSASLELTSHYISKNIPIYKGNMKIVAGIYNGGPEIFKNISDGEVGTSIIKNITKYIEKATEGYNYFNAVYKEN